MIGLLLWATVGAAFLSQEDAGEDVRGAWDLFWEKFTARGGRLDLLPEGVQVELDRRQSEGLAPPGWLRTPIIFDKPAALREIVPYEYRNAVWREKVMQRFHEPGLTPSPSTLPRLVRRHGAQNILGLEAQRELFRRWTERTDEIYVILFEPNRDNAKRAFLLRSNYDFAAEVTPEMAMELLQSAETTSTWEGWTGFRGGPYDAYWIRAIGAT